MDGIILLDKDSNISTRDYCFKVAKKLNIKKFGHLGTLDPLASGLVIMLINKATKLDNYLGADIKQYFVKILLGKTTDTYDITGKIIEENQVDIDQLRLNEALNELKSRKTQVPPIYSAIKVNGKKLYEYARGEKVVQIEERPAEIFGLELINFSQEEGQFFVEVRLLVSKGFYVRSFAYDLGQILDCGATVYELRREKCGDFDVKNAKKLQQIMDENDIISVEKLFENYPKIDIDSFTYNLIKNGCILDSRQATYNSIFRVYYQNQLVALYKPIEDGQYKIIYFSEAIS